MGPVGAKAYLLDTHAIASNKETAVCAPPGTAVLGTLHQPPNEAQFNDIHTASVAGRRKWAGRRQNPASWMGANSLRPQRTGSVHVARLCSVARTVQPTRRRRRRPWLHQPSQLASRIFRPRRLSDALLHNANPSHP